MKSELDIIADPNVDLQGEVFGMDGLELNGEIPAQHFKSGKPP